MTNNLEISKTGQNAIELAGIQIIGFVDVQECQKDNRHYNIKLTTCHSAILS